MYLNRARHERNLFPKYGFNMNNEESRDEMKEHLTQSRLSVGTVHFDSNSWNDGGSKSRFWDK